MIMYTNHSFHLVNFRPWPLIGAVRTLILVTGIVKWFHQLSLNLFFLAFIFTTIIIYQWWRDISRERTFQGLHTINVTNGIKWGIILFITSEIFFFYHFSEDFSIED